MGVGLLFALSLPGLVVLLVILAAAEQTASRCRRRSPLTRQHRPTLSAGDLDVVAAVLVPGKEHELAQRSIEQARRDDEHDGAPRGGIDLRRGTASIPRAHSK